MTTTLVTLRQRVSENIGDWLSSTVTTALTTSANLVDTALANVEGGGTDNYFKDWWVIITSNANIDAVRKVSTYTASTKTIVVLGGNWADDGANLATYELHRLHPNYHTRALNMSARELFPTLFRPFHDRSLISGNACPVFRFTSSTALDFYTTSNSAIAKTTTAGLYYGQIGLASAKVTASAANGRIHISSDAFPRLLDLKGKTVDAKVWVNPQTADDATIAIYSIDASGNEETFTSTTSCPAGKWTLISTMGNTIQSDAEEIQIRLIVATNGQYAYFMTPRATGDFEVYDFIVPYNFQDGIIRQARRQISGESADACDDIGMVRWRDVFGWKIIDDGTYKYIRLPYIPEKLMIELIGYEPLEDNLSSDTDTVSLNDPQTELLSAYATMLLYQQQRGLPSFDSTALYNTEVNYWRGRVETLKKTHRMTRPHGQISWETGSANAWRR